MCIPPQNEGGILTIPHMWSIVRIPPSFWGGIGKYPISVQRNWVAIPPEVRSTEGGITAQFRGTLIGYFPIPPQNEGGIHIIIQKMIVPSLLIWMSFIYKRRQKSPLNLQRVSRYWIQYPPPLCIIDKGVGGKIQYPPPLCIINKGVEGIESNTSPPFASLTNGWGYWIQYLPPLCIIVIINDKRLAVPRLIPGILFSKDESFSA